MKAKAKRLTDRFYSLDPYHRTCVMARLVGVYEALEDKKEANNFFRHFDFATEAEEGLQLDQASAA